MSEQFYPSGKPNILITGGAGFIGSHLAEELIQNNHVIVVDNFISSSEKNIDHLLQHPNFEFIRHDMTMPLDLTDEQQFPELRVFEMKVQGVQEIYHLACPTSPRDYHKFPIETLLANSYGTKNALDVAVKWKAKFLFLSSATIYGVKNDTEMIPEDYTGHLNTIGPSACYDEGKRFSETLVYNYGQKYNLDTSIARVFETYGPHMRINDGRVVPDFISAALNNQPIEIEGDESYTRVYCYVSDMVDALIKLMASDIKEPINLGGIEEYKVVDIAREIIRLTGSSSDITFSPPLPNFKHRQLVPDITQAKERLGWLPMVRLTDGLQKTIDDMKVNAHLYGI